MAATPTPTLPKLRVAVESEACTTPVPLRLTIWGLPGALSVNKIELAKVPAVVGANVTLTVHEAFGASENEPVAGHGLVPMRGSVKGAVGETMPETTNVAVPLFVRRTDFDALVVPMA